MDIANSVKSPSFLNATLLATRMPNGFIFSYGFMNFFLNATMFAIRTPNGFILIHSFMNFSLKSEIYTSPNVSDVSCIIS